MTTKDTGGPAFPRTRTVEEKRQEEINLQIPVEWGDGGMTLRDYFAAKAMQSCLSGVDCPSIEKCAEFSYKMADAMLEAKNETLALRNNVLNSSF